MAHAEVESALKEHPAVLESAAVGSPDEARGEIVKAFIVLSDEYRGHPDKPALIREIQEHVKRSAAPYKYPREVSLWPDRNLGLGHERWRRG
jgi:medium-chain acyl-CoA synthetase